jgi:hypothetical protein
MDWPGTSTWLPYPDMPVCIFARGPATGANLVNAPAILESQHCETFEGDTFTRGFGGAHKLGLNKQPFDYISVF